MNARIKSQNIIPIYLRMGLFFLFILLFELTANAQYFGRNRPGYRSFNFKVYESPHFTFYHYFDNDSVINALANRFEHWYIRHSQLFTDTFEKPSPILIYQNHPEFQQTTAISGGIGIGTSGVTEALKNRVVIPVLETNSQTDHVIGHELVHVFHFRALYIDDSLSLNSLRNLPLWLVEGMAEYFSIGSVDAHTSMIIRDAIKEDDFPSLAQMTRDYSYNPYRYGHSFVAFLGRTWGDDIIAPLYRETAKFGYERAMERIIGLNATTVSDLWKSANITHFQPYLDDTLRHIPIGERVLSEENAGNLNISPSLSPDGKHVAFFSERDLFSLDLFLADATTGRIRRKLSSTTRSADIDAFNFFESVGSWSPDGSKFVHVAVKRGRNQLVVVDVKRPRRSRHIPIDGVPSLNNPAWSPDGKTIVFTGLVDGIGNLYSFDIETRKVEKITNDRYSYIHPSWSPDGRYLAVATDLLPAHQQRPDTVNYNFNLGIIDMQSPNREIRVLNVFPTAVNINPVFDLEGDGIYFLSNRDGFRNLYHYNLTDDKVHQLTNYYTGITGITHTSPAITVARNTGQIGYSYFQDGKYSIFSAEPSDFTMVEVDPFEIDMTAATLAPFIRNASPMVDEFLATDTSAEVFPVDSFEVKRFRPQFGLTYIGSSGVGASTSRFGTGMNGGVSMMFSDIVGNHQLFSVLQINGEVYDFGGQVGYVNQQKRINWGGSVSHIPYPFAYMGVGRDTLGQLPVIDYQFVIQRTFETQFGMFAFYPISTTRRIEMSASNAWYYFRRDIFHTYYYENGIPFRQDRTKGESPEGFNLQRVSLGYVGDNSYFGMASPMTGHRYRFSVEKLFGEIDMFNVTADYRKYFFRNPLSIAFRVAHYGRYGKNANNNLFYPLYLGYPGYMRGFDYSSLYNMRENIGNNFLQKLQGSRMLLGGLEFKVPFTGPKRLALISSGFLFTELNWFLDAGLAWENNSSITIDKNEMDITGPNRFPVFSTGPSIRVNLFGAIILEPYFAIPFTLKERFPAVWGLSFWPGW
jgi:Tol biopolymer transport system component